MERIVLRENPVFEISIDEQFFEIKDATDKDISGTYRFTDTTPLQLKTAKTNWFGTIITVLLELIYSQGGTSGQMRSRNKLIFHYRKRKMVAVLDGCDLDLARSTVNLINENLK